LFDKAKFPLLHFLKNNISQSTKRFSPKIMKIISSSYYRRVITSIACSQSPLWPASWKRSMTVRTENMSFRSGKDTTSHIGRTYSHGRPTRLVRSLTVAHHESAPHRSSDVNGQVSVREKMPFRKTAAIVISANHNCPPPSANRSTKPTRRPLIWGLDAGADSQRFTAFLPKGQCSGSGGRAARGLAERYQRHNSKA